MGTWIWTTMRIGGKAPKAAWRAILEAADEEFLEGECPPPGDEHSYDNNGAPLILSGQTSFGNAEQVCALCRRHGLTYERNCEGYAPEFGPEIETWQPGWEDPILRTANERGEVVVTLENLQIAHTECKTLADVIAELSHGALEVPAMEVAEEDPT